MKKIIIVLAAAAFALCGCSGDGGGSSALTVNFDISANPCNEGEDVTFTNKSKGGKSPYKCEWHIGSETILSGSAVTHKFSSNGTFVVRLVVTDASGDRAERRKNLVVNPAVVGETGELTLDWVGRMEGYNSVAAAAVADDGSVYSTCRDNHLYKFSSTGELQWRKPIFTATSENSFTYVTPSIDADGTIFCGGGSVNGDGVYVAFNPDGSEKWRFKDFWAANGSPTPSCFALIPGIDENCIYVGNTGVTGSVLSIDKATGRRVAFCKHGSNGPTGGARTGIAISKDGTLHWYGGVYGLFGAVKSNFGSAGADGADYAWSTFSSGGASDYAQMATLASLACTTINGDACVCGMSTDLISTKLYAVDCKTGREISTVRIFDTDDQDQGGIVITPEGYMVGSLNYTLGQANGGIVIGDPKTSQIVARYQVQEKVSGAAAVDAAGNIHFGTESGYYYIVKVAGANCELLLKRNIASLITEDPRYASSFSELYEAKIWCSPTIGDDGRIYICFTDEDTRAFGGVAVLRYEGCTGPSASEWPMMGRNRRHTNNQN